MTSPFHAFEIKGKGRYYHACGPACPIPQGVDLISVTNAQSVVAKPALVPAAVKVTAEKSWDVVPRMVAMLRQTPNGPNGCERRRVADRCGSCRFCLTAEIKAEHRNQWESKAELGSRVHTHAYARVVGQAIEYDPEVAPFIAQYIAFLQAWHVDLDEHVEAAELTVIDLKRLYAGTGDVWLWLPLRRNRAGEVVNTSWGDRRLWLIDIKTSLTKPATAVYPDQELQLAGLRFAPSAILPDDSLVDVPKFEGAALLNLRQAEHALIPLPADRDAYRAFLAAVEMQRFFHGQDIKAWTPLDVPPVTEPSSSSTRKAS